MRRTQIHMMKNLCAYDRSVVSSILKVRPGETKVGEALHFLSKPDNTVDSNVDFSRRLEEVVGKGARYAVIGIPEDVGPRANLGRGTVHNIVYAVIILHCYVYEYIV